MAKIVLDDNISNTDAPTQPYNNNFQKIASEFQNKVLYRDNPQGEPNAMSTSIDMNGHRILNLPNPISDTEPMTLKGAHELIGNAPEYAEAAEQAASAAEFSETNARQSEVNAKGSELAAASSQINAASSEQKAEKWAEEQHNVEVEPGKYSAKHWAEEAEEISGGSAYLKKVNNLNDVADPSAARGNLLLGSSAVRDSQTDPSDPTPNVLMLTGAGGVGLSNAPVVTDLNNLPGSFVAFSFSNEAVGAPNIGIPYDATGIQVRSSGQITQYVTVATDFLFLVRVNDDGISFTPWRQIGNTGPSTVFWNDVIGKPDTATRWPSWGEVGGRPVTAERWPSWGEISDKPGEFRPITTAGAVGSFCFAQVVGSNGPGTTRGGDNLKYCNANGVDVSGGSPAGTWRCMGASTNGPTGQDSTLWVRIS